MIERDEFFIQQSIAAALDMPHRDCVRFLQGMLIFGGEHEAAAVLRKIVRAKADADSQLELIANGQLKMEELLKS